MNSREEDAWYRRNQAGHGHHTDTSDYINHIRETNLIRIIFVRIIMDVTKDNDQYIDYFTISYPIRKVGEAIPSS